MGSHQTRIKKRVSLTPVSMPNPEHGEQFLLKSQTNILKSQFYRLKCGRSHLPIAGSDSGNVGRSRDVFGGEKLLEPYLQGYHLYSALFMCRIFFFCKNFPNVRLKYSQLESIHFEIVVNIVQIQSYAYFKKKSHNWFFLLFKSGVSRSMERGK